jgi:hypothetical protein
VRQKRWAEARRQLDTLLAVKHPTNPAEFHLDDRPAAEEMLTNLPQPAKRDE